MLAKCLLLSSMVLFVLPPSLFAHDMWIEPKTFQPTADSVVGVQLRIGDRPAEANPVVRDPERIVRFVVGKGQSATDGQSEVSIIGRAGMAPAGFLRTEKAGLRILGYQSRSSFIELEAEKFETYLAEEGLDTISALRAQRGEQDKNGQESYARCLKALLAVESTTPQDRDRALGLPLEFIAEVNPYQHIVGTPFPVQLLFDGQPLKGALVEARPLDGGEASVAMRTDADGRITLRFPSAGAWLLSAVHMVDVKDSLNQEHTEADWQSYWASLTFSLPEG